MANVITSQGVFTPYVKIQFASGVIDIMPPTYFVSLTHNRNTKKATTFEITVTYVPNAFEVGQPDLLHNFLLSSCKQDITFNYGYYGWDGTIISQDATYIGKFTTYSENINDDSTLTYTIKGYGKAFESLSDTLTIESSTGKPSERVSEIIEMAKNLNNQGSSMWDSYNLDISNIDEEVEKIEGATNTNILDYIMGTVQTDGTRKGGLVSLSHLKTIGENEKLNSMDIYKLISKGILTNQDYYNYSLHPDEATINNINNLMNEPFICYFDDKIVNGKPTFHYKPKTLSQYTNSSNASSTFIYEVANNVKDSDVLSFNVTYSSEVAMASTSSLDTTKVDADCDGNVTGASNMSLNVDDLGINTYILPSEFKRESMMARNLLAEKLIYPFKATLEILGQVIPSNLLDVINVIVLINGTEHPSLTGTYTVVGITDNLSSSGFTTTLSLVRRTNNSSVDKNYESYIATHPDAVASKDEQAMKDSNSEN